MEKKKAVNMELAYQKKSLVNFMMDEGMATLDQAMQKLVKDLPDGIFGHLLEVNLNTAESTFEGDFVVEWNNETWFIPPYFVERVTMLR